MNINKPKLKYWEHTVMAHLEEETTQLILKGMPEERQVDIIIFHNLKDYPNTIHLNTQERDPSLEISFEALKEITDYIEEYNLKVKENGGKTLWT